MNTTKTQTRSDLLIDGLTHLPNRHALISYLETSMSKATDHGRNIALCVIDIDRMRAINEEFGYSAGDAVIKKLGEEIRSILQPNDFLARFGGDEFAIVMYYNNFDRITSVIERILKASSQTMKLAGFTRLASISVGCSVFPECGDDVEDVIAMADQAAGRALRSGGNCSIYFDSSMRKDLEKRKWIEAEIEPAISSKKIRPFYQPLINLYDDSVVGFEVLARWFDNNAGQIFPDQFIPVAEKIGKIEKLTNYLIDQVTDFAIELGGDFIFAINLSPLQLIDPQCAEKIIEKITAKNLSMTRFEFEVTENVLIEDIKTASQVLSKLRASGASIGLDDFGAGYSSLQYIRTLPFDKIKIDRAYVKDILTHDGSTIVNAVLSLSNALGFTATAEGIEDIETVDMLKALGCGRGQGWYYGKAIPDFEIPAFLVEYSAKRLAAQAKQMATEIKSVDMSELPDLPEEYREYA